MLTHQTSHKQVARTDGEWQARTTVATIVERHGRFLFVEEFADPKQPDRLLINQPAGHVEANETLIQAAERETLEETGWHVEVTDFLGIYTYQPKPHVTYYRMCFLATAINHNPSQTLDTGILKASWYTPEELETKTNLRSLLVSKCVQDAVAGKRYPLDIISEFLLSA